VIVNSGPPSKFHDERDILAHEAFTLRHHGGQADAYAGALGRASGRTVAGVSFVYGRTSAEVWVQRGRAAS
jgi:hypothetical protein